MRVWLTRVPSCLYYLSTQNIESVVNTCTIMSLLFIHTEHWEYESVTVECCYSPPSQTDMVIKLGLVNKKQQFPYLVGCVMKQKKKQPRFRASFSGGVWSKNDIMINIVCMHVFISTQVRLFITHYFIKISSFHLSSHLNQPLITTVGQVLVDSFLFDSYFNYTWLITIDLS